MATSVYTEVCNLKARKCFDGQYRYIFTSHPNGIDLFFRIQDAVTYTSMLKTLKLSLTYKIR